MPYTFIMESTSEQGNFKYVGRQLLESNELLLRSYNTSIIELVLSNSPTLKSDSEVLDFGAGVGTLSSILLEKTNTKPVTLEIDETQREILVSRGFKVIGDLRKQEKRFDLIFTSNVLEHIEDDLAVLKELSLCLKDFSSRLIIYVPAFPLLFSDLDRSVDHYRRYSKKDLVEKIKKSGMEVQKCHYADSIGFFATIIIKLIGWKNSVDFTSDKSMRVYDRYIFPLSKTLDKILLKRLLGKNLFAVASLPLPLGKS